MARQKTHSNQSNDLKSEFENFVSNWYYNRANEPMEIKINLPKNIMLGRLIIRVESRNSKSDYKLVDNKKDSLAMSFVCPPINRKIPDNKDPNFIKRLSFITHLYLILKEWGRYKSGFKTLFDDFLYRDHDYPILDLSKILYSVIHSDFSSLLHLYSEYDFSKIPPYVSGKPVSLNKIKNIVKDISDALFTNKITLSEPILGELNIESFQFEKKGKNIEEYVFRKKVTGV